MKKVLPVMLFTGFVLQATSLCWSQHAVISRDTVEIYDLPGIAANPVAVLSKGDTVRVIGQRGNWIKIVYQNQSRAWMPIDIEKPEYRGETTGDELEPGKDITSDANQGIVHGQQVFAAAPVPDRIIADPEPEQPVTEPTPRAPDFGPRSPGRFGYSFSAGLMESDFAYSWRFVFHTTPKLTMNGMFKHVLGEAADSYIMLTSFNWFFSRQAKTLPYFTAGMGVITTVPERSIDLDSVSHMMLNYGIGIRQYVHKSISLTFGVSQNTVFVESQTNHFREFSFGFLVGRFWN
jgi:hypothetical protein